MWRLAAFLIAMATQTAAQNVGTATEEAASNLKAAGLQLAQAGGARDRVRALTATVRAYEEGLIAMRDGLRQAAVEEQVLRTQLDARRVEVSQLLGVLQATSGTAGPVATLHPSGALGTARAGMIVADVTPALQAEVDRLSAQLQEISDLQALQASATDTLREGLRGAQQARARLSEAIAERTDLPIRFTQDPEQTALMIASTETLEGFASGLTAAVSTIPGTTNATNAKGRLPLPVQGQRLRAFNQPDAAGIARPGMILAARPKALVTAPAPATLLFHGPLLDYGNVVILEPAPEVLIVLAGLSEVFGKVGQVLPAGTPVGLMGGDAPNPRTILTENGEPGPAAATQTLYLEVREGQTPVDPATWFVTN